MLKNLRRKAPEKDKLGHDLFKFAKVSILSDLQFLSPANIFYYVCQGHVLLLQIVRFKISLVSLQK